MEITVSQEQGRISVSVIKLTGHLDGQTYESLISKAREIVEAGSRNILLDLGELTYISSAGLVSLHTMSAFWTWSALRTSLRSLQTGKRRSILFSFQVFLQRCSVQLHRC